MTKIQRAALTLILITTVSVALIGVAQNSPVSAQTQAQPRYKYVQRQVTQYVWDLLLKSSGAVICEVVIENDGLPTQQDARNACTDKIVKALPTPDMYMHLDQYTDWYFVTTRQYTVTDKVQIPDIILNVIVPTGGVKNPYAELVAYEPVSEYSITSIQGTIEGADFSCNGGQCYVPVTQFTHITFYANSSLGDHSQELTAIINVVFQSDGYHVSIYSMTPAVTFDDACEEIWGLDFSSSSKWVEFPRLPDLLNTNKALYYLASRLIMTGLVDASDCPGMGLFDNGSPNSCGIDRATKVMTDWQNQFDPLIWSAGQVNGIPPKLIKTLLEKESQFWPGNAITFKDEFGLAQMNETGADVALRWNMDLFKQACDGLLTDCSVPYASLSSWEQAMVRGKLMSMVNSDCATCVNGLNLATANASIDIFTKVIRANCAQTNFIMNDNSARAPYEDMWKFTLVSFHSGYTCLNNAIVSTKKSGQAIKWENVSQNIDCPGAKQYVDDVFTNLTNFDQYLLPVTAVSQFTSLPTFAPTATRVPIPTPVLSHNSVLVLAYLVFANRPLTQNATWVDGLPVEVTLPNGDTLRQVIQNGQTIFNLSQYPVGTVVTISLPSLFRSQSIQLTEQGEIMVFFRLEQPQLPVLLP